MYIFTKQEDGNFIFEKTVTSINGGKRNDHVQKVYDLSKEELISAADGELKIWSAVIKEAEEQIKQITKQLDVVKNGEKIKK